MAPHIQIPPKIKTSGIKVFLPPGIIRPDQGYEPSERHASPGHGSQRIFFHARMDDTIDWNGVRVDMIFELTRLQCLMHHIGWMRYPWYAGDVLRLPVNERINPRRFIKCYAGAPTASSLSAIRLSVVKRMDLVIRQGSQRSMGLCLQKGTANWSEIWVSA